MATPNTCLQLTRQVYGHSAVAPGSQQLKGVDLLPVAGGEGRAVQQQNGEGRGSFGRRLLAVDGQGLQQPNIFATELMIMMMVMMMVMILMMMTMIKTGE